MRQFLSLPFLAGIYFYARGVFALFGHTIFYTKRSLENIDEANLPAYLKEIGWAHIGVGTVFVAKAILNVIFPGSRPVLYGWLLVCLVCVYFLSKIDSKYRK